MFDQVYVTCIIGDPNKHSELVEEPKDMEFEKVIDLVLKGYRLKKLDWINGFVVEQEASTEIEVMHSITPIEIEGTDSEKVKILI